MGDTNLKKNIPIFSPILKTFLSPNKNEGLKIPNLENCKSCNFSSTKPLYLKYSPALFELANPEETNIKELTEFNLAI